MATFDQVFASVACGDAETVGQRFEDESDKEQILGARDAAGRSVLAVASMLGRSGVIRELVRHGAEVNELDASGYSPLHFAACWGRAGAVRTLLGLGADTHATNLRGERPVDLARKYSRTDCVDCLVVADAKQEFVSYIGSIKDTISASEGHLTRDEKNISSGVFSAISNWIETFENPTVSDFAAQRKDTEDKLQSILNKISGQPVDVPAKASRRF